jgi:hypothetical protein
MSVLKTLAKVGREFTAAIKSASADVASLRAQIRAKRTERAAAHGAPCPPDEVIARFEAWVDELATWWRRERGADAVKHCFGAPEAPKSPWNPNDQVRWADLCGFAGPALKASFAELVHATEYTPGPTTAARPGVVERLDRELAELEATEEALIDQAVAAGVQIAHRPEVLERREAERLKRERAEAAELVRLASEAVPAARPEQYRAARSQYINPR